MTNFRPDRSGDDHAGHDRPLIVAYACGDLDPGEALAARALIAACRRCAALVDEIALLQASIAADSGAPRRQRDFRLSADDAERLRAGPLTRLLRRLGGPGLSILQPLAGAAMAIGLVLVVATGALPSLGLGAASGGALPASAADTRQGEFGPSATGDTSAVGSQGAPGATPAPGAPAVKQDEVIDTPTQPTEAYSLVLQPGFDPGLLLGIVLVVAGLTVFVVRVAARRVAEDPLLR
jgi:anti-sigma factor RsiW